MGVSARLQCLIHTARHIPHMSLWIHNSRHAIPPETILRWIQNSRPVRNRPVNYNIDIFKIKVDHHWRAPIG